MKLDTEKYNKIREYLLSEGFSATEAHRMLEAADDPSKFDNRRLAKEVYKGCEEIIHRICLKRCPGRPGYSEKCARCIVQNVFSVLRDEFQYKCAGAMPDIKDDFKAFDALLWLVVEEHKPDHFCW